MKITARLDKFDVWESEPKNKLVIRCRNRYGSYAHFVNHDGAIVIGFGDRHGFEPDKDAISFDKVDLPAVIAFLQNATEGLKP